MAVAVVLFTRDLRVSDNPALHAAVTGHERVVPLFVLDDGILRGAYNRPNRARFLAESLADLHASLLARGGALVVRRGEVVEEAVRLAEAVGADAVHVAGDVSGYAKRRTERLREALGDRLVVHEDSIVAVPPGRIAPVGKAHMAVFTPYHRRWEGTGKRDPLPAPERIELPAVPGGRGSMPAPADIHAGEPSP